MFIFYYAVLSKVSSPTALSQFAAATITRADPYITTLQSWKYAPPAFVVPFIFVLDPRQRPVRAHGVLRRRRGVAAGLIGMAVLGLAIACETGQAPRTGPVSPAR